MNASQLKSIPIGVIVEKLGGEFESQISTHRDKYKSPLRTEQKGSFYVYRDNNKWHDFGHVGNVKSGDGLDLIREFMKEQGIPNSVSEGLAFAKDLLGGVSLEGYNKNTNSAPGQSKNRIIVDSVRDELSPSSLNYVKEKRGITSMGIIRNNLKQVHFHFEKTPDRRLFATAFPNDKGGFELRAENKAGLQIKYVANDKAITKIKGADRTKLKVFEGFFNYLTHLQREGLKTPDTDVIVLNSSNMVKEAIPVIQSKEYSEIDVYRDNDVSSKKMLDLLEDEVPGVSINDKSHLYKGFSDYNEMHVMEMNQLQKSQGMKKLA